jgi:PHD/YefM family antitoxin component YafN of YafNO toxin-antitoxin module
MNQAIQDIQYVSDAQGNAISVIVPIALWQAIQSEQETTYLMSSPTMKQRILEARQETKQDMSFEVVCEKLDI